MRSAAALCLALAAGGCVSHVGHSPRIEAGTRWNVTPSAAVSSADFQDDAFGFMPSLWVGLGHGWVRENGPALYVAGQVPALLLPWAFFSTDETMEAFAWMVAGDVYVQPRRAREGGIDAGVGVIASRSLAMPYVQLGRAGDGGFYTTQGFAFTHGEFRQARYWMPGIAIRSERADGRRAVDFYLGAIVGGYDVHTGLATRERRTEWILTFGAVAEIRRPPQ